MAEIWDAYDGQFHKVAEAALVRGQPIPEGMGWAKALVDGGSAVYDGTQTEYFPEAVDAFRKMKEDLARAEKYIFMEYFIVEDGEAFRELEEIPASTRQRRSTPRAS